MFDVRLSVGDALAIDLLPQQLSHEQGTFRFGTSPWAEHWQTPLQMWDDEEALDELIAHGRW